MKKPETRPSWRCVVCDGVLDGSEATEFRLGPPIEETIHHSACDAEYNRRCAASALAAGRELNK